MNRVLSGRQLLVEGSSSQGGQQIYLHRKALPGEAQDLIGMLSMRNTSSTRQSFLQLNLPWVERKTRMVIRNLQAFAIHFLSQKAEWKNIDFPVLEVFSV